MTEKPISTVEEKENPDTAPTKESAETTPPDNDLNLTELMFQMSSKELIQVSFVALAILNRRQEEAAAEAQDNDD